MLARTWRPEAPHGKRDSVPGHRGERQPEKRRRAHQQPEQQGDDQQHQRLRTAEGPANGELPCGDAHETQCPLPASKPGCLPADAYISAAARVSGKTCTRPSRRLVLRRLDRHAVTRFVRRTAAVDHRDHEEREDRRASSRRSGSTPARKIGSCDRHAESIATLAVSRIGRRRTTQLLRIASKSVAPRASDR